MSQQPYQHNALIHQSRTRRAADLNTAVSWAIKYPGLTATQLSWLAVGGQLDTKGHCVPEDLFNQCMQFFNFKRRFSENAAERGKETPRTKFIYGTALKNPYTEAAGQGIYPRGYKVPARTRSAPMPEPMPLKPSALSAPAPVPCPPPADFFANLTKELGE